MASVPAVAIILIIKKTDMEDFGKFCYVLLLVLLGTLISGFVFMKMWGWVIEPTFNTITLNFAQATGVCMVLSFLFYRKGEKKDANIKDLTTLFIDQIFVQLLFLGIAKIASLYIN